MHQVSALEPDCCRLRIAGIVGIMKCEIMQLYIQIHLPAKAYEALSDVTAISSIRPWEHNTGWRSSTISVLFRAVCVISDHKPLVAIPSEGMVTLSQ